MLYKASTASCGGSAMVPQAALHLDPEACVVSGALVNTCPHQIIADGRCVGVCDSSLNLKARDMCARSPENLGCCDSQDHLSFEDRPSLLHAGSSFK